MSTLTNTESAILSRIIAPDEPGMSVELAHACLALGFNEEDRDQMRILSEKANAGTLTPDEQEEINGYERVGHFISLLHSKARFALKQAGAE